jgi:thiaminase/transcriptional activator TenA
MRNYSLSAEQVEFFTAHEEIGTHVKPVDQMLLARYSTLTDRQLITRAVRLSHEFELMFYDTIMEPTSS